jgi:hypothetical protein
MTMGHRLSDPFPRLHFHSQEQAAKVALDFAPYARKAQGMSPDPAVPIPKQEGVIMLWTQRLIAGSLMCLPGGSFGAGASINPT